MAYPVEVAIFTSSRALAKPRQPWIDARNDSEELDDRKLVATRELPWPT